MSPTEFDLREALRDGEGQGREPSADRIIDTVRGNRAARRARMLSSAAAVLLVAGVVTGGAFLLRDNGDDTSSSDSAAGAGAKVPAAASAARSARVPGNLVGGVATACPASYPRTFLPGGGSPGQFGASGRLFAKPVATITVCSYPMDANGATTKSPASRASGVLVGSDARALVRSLENASRTRRIYPCPTGRTADTLALALVPLATDGTPLRTVTTTLTVPACNVQVTNGTAVRYNWAPTATVTRSLRSALATSSGTSAATSTATSPATSPATSVPTPPRVDGSPAH